MLSRTYPQTPQPIQTQVSADARARASATAGQALTDRLQSSLAFATVLLASWGTWGLAGWMIANWQLR